MEDGQMIHGWMEDEQMDGWEEGWEDGWMDPLTQTKRLDER